MKMEELVLNEERRVRLSVWIQDIGGEYAPINKRPAILVLPGGGYSMCSDREAEPVAAAFMKAGYQAFILRYSTGEHKTWPNPLNDYEQAMTLLHSRAEEWHVDAERIAVIGFSAGGHLAACAATVAENKPAAVILGYAAMKKDICDMCQPGMPYPVEEVNHETVPCFLFATRDDYVVDITNTIDFQRKLAENGIAFESHIYSYGMHGFSTAEPYLNQAGVCSRAGSWVQDSISWLGEIWGHFTAKGFTSPVLSRKMNADGDPMLSLECTVGYLKNQGEAAAELMKEQFAAIDRVIQGRFTNTEAAAQTIDGYKMKDVLQMILVPEDIIHALDIKLRQIVNKRI